MATISLHPPVKSRETSPTRPSPSSSPGPRPTSPRHYYYPPPTSTNYPTSPYHRPTSPKYPSSPKYTLSPSHRKPTGTAGRHSPSGRHSPAGRLSPNNLTNNVGNATHLLKPTPMYPETTTNRSLQCAVCMKSYKDARMLPCFHTFCAGCLELSCLQKREKGSNVDSVYCPICMDSSDLTSRGIQGLPRNMYVAHLQDLQQSSSSSRLTCDLCVNCEVAVKRCKKCACNLCEFCMQAHQKQRKTSLHQLIDLTNQAPKVGVSRGGAGGMYKVGARERRKVVYCETHDREEVQFHCKDCNVPMCKKCALTNHSTHIIVPLEEADSHYSEVLQGLLTRAQPLAATLGESIRNLEFVTSNVQQRSEVVSEEIIEFISCHMKALQEHKRSLLLQLDAVKKQKENTLKMQMAHLTGVQSELKASCDVASKALKEGTPSTAFISTSSVASKLEGIVSTKLETSPKEDDYIHFHTRVPVEERDGFHMYGLLDSRGPSAANTTAEGEGLFAAREGKLAQFKVRVHDRYKQQREMGGDKLEAIMSGQSGEAVNMSISDNEDGTYAVMYTPPSPGEYRMSVLIQDKHIRGSPFVVSVRRKANRHRGVFHCCTFCSSAGKKHVRCGCGSTMPGGYSGCGHGHPGHPGRRHWSCCGSTVEMSDCLV